MRNAEQVLISATLNTADMVTPLNEGVTPSWFREYRNEWTFIAARYKKTRTTPSARTFKLKFPKFKLLTADDMDYAIGEMRSYHTKQSLMLLMDDAVQAIEGGRDVTDLVQNMYRGLVDLTGEVAGQTNEAELISGWRASYTDALIRAKKRNRGATMGIPTGYPTLDLVTGGYNPGEYWVFGARLGQGKTWALIRSAVAALEDGKTVQYHALEQTKTQLGMRFAPFLSSRFNPTGEVFKTSDIQHGTVDVIGYRKFLQVLEGKAKGRLILDDTPRRKLTSLMLSAKIERNKPDMVIVDYLGLMNSSPGDWTMVAALSADMKEMATTYGIPMLVANQLNRTAGIGVKSAGPEALAGADAIGQDADGVVTLKRESKRTSSMYLAKYRHGEDGNRWMMHFDPNNGIFDEISEDKAMDLRDQDDAA